MWEGQDATCLFERLESIHCAEWTGGAMKSLRKLTRVVVFVDGQRCGRVLTGFLVSLFHSISRRTGRALNMKRNNIPACTREWKVYTDPSEIDAEHDRRNTAERSTLMSFKPSRMWFTTSSVTRWHPFARLESVNVVCQPIVFLSSLWKGWTNPWYALSMEVSGVDRVSCGRIGTEIEESARNSLVI